MPVPDYTDSWLGSLLAGCGEAAGMVSVLAERAASEGPRSTRAVETTPAASLGEYWGAGLRQRQTKQFALARAVFDQEDEGALPYKEGNQQGMCRA
jgi:hypothetical protein